MYEKMIATREYREKLLQDPYRPTFHFTVPDSNGVPGDPNGAFFYDGVYHLMYLYSSLKTNSAHWGHISSVDLIHWRHHPDALTIADDGSGCFSGGAFVDDDGTAYLSFWKFPSKDFEADNGGISLAYSNPPYDVWERLSPIAIHGSRDVWGTVDIEVNGKIEHIGCADPSNIWKANGYYYIQAGNKCVLDKYGRDENSEEHYQGDWTDLFRSKDLKSWEFVHRFYTNPHKDADWPDKTEDDMCPSFLPLYNAKENGEITDKWLQLFISHNKGCQYYIGTLKNETFIPETHGRMTWKDNAYFAPEALIDDRNRHIIWTWLLDNLPEDLKRYGWSGVFGFPRTVWWADGQLKMAPAAELDLLQYNPHTPEIQENNNVKIKNGDLFRLKAEIDMTSQEKAGFCVRVGSDNQTRTEIYYDKKNKAIIFDAVNSGEEGWKIKEEAPFTLQDGELLSLDIFVDKSVVEVYANELQAICRRVYPQNPADATGVQLIGDKDKVIKLQAWEMAPANPY